MYDELIKNLRLCSECDFGQNCNECTQERTDKFCCDELLHKAADAIDELQKQLREEKVDNVNLTGWLAEEHAKHLWIPVTERLPERNYNCLVADDGTIVYGYMNFIGEWMDCLGDKLKYVTHWMPLPQPPEKEDIFYPNECEKEDGES